MALVYRGIQDSLQRPVAIKVLTQELGDHDEARRRFERESLIIARLNHPNIIHVIDRGINAQGMPYFVMEFVAGLDLGTAVQAMSLTHIQQIDIIIQLLKALAYAHKNKVIHRDIKPDNILVDDDCNIKVLDFGIAQFYDELQVPGEKTTHGTVMGTYSYMSPEQKKSADNVTAQSDLYSVGVLMYKLFTGQIPEGHFPEPSRLNPEVSPHLDRIVLQCLAPRPEDRPASAEELKNALLSAMQGAHLKDDQRQRAAQGITQIKSRFQLLDVLREDKFGAVYLYQQKQSGSLLVIKKKVSTSSGFTTSNMLTALNHDNIVTTLGTIRNEEFFILVQEYLSGGTLQDKLGFQIEWQDAVRIGCQICQALLFAHQHQFVHGHLRPTNILFTDQGQVKITDFGLQDDVSNVPNAHYYRLSGEAVSAASDVYAAGVILYQLFTGSLPAQNKDTATVIRKAFTKLPEDVQSVISVMLSTVPERRSPQCLQTTVEVLRRYLNKPAPTQILPVTDLEPGKPMAADSGTTALAAAADLAALTAVDRHSAIVNSRMMKMFSVLLLVYSQYMLFFDGQQRINESMPLVYSQVANSMTSLFGG
ncbi:MAG: hypothetical protein RLZZ385_228 [Pseudomonadota bacterium]